MWNLLVLSRTDGLSSYISFFPNISDPWLLSACFHNPFWLLKQIKDQEAGDPAETATAEILIWKPVSLATLQLWTAPSHLHPSPMAFKMRLFILSEHIISGSVSPLMRTRVLQVRHVSQRHQITKAILSCFSYQDNLPNRIKVLIHASLEAVSSPQMSVASSKWWRRRLTSVNPVLCVGWATPVTHQRSRCSPGLQSPMTGAIIFSIKARKENKPFVVSICLFFSILPKSVPSQALSSPSGLTISTGRSFQLEGSYVSRRTSITRVLSFPPYFPESFHWMPRMTGGQRWRALGSAFLLL